MLVSELEFAGITDSLKHVKHCSENGRMKGWGMINL